MRLPRVLVRRTGLFVNVAFVCAVGWALAVAFLDAPRNECGMTYMHPAYARVAVDNEGASTQKPHVPYALFHYVDGGTVGTLDMDSRIPVLFVPGNAGSYKQARSLGGVLRRLAEAGLIRGVHLDVFTVDFGDELSGLSGAILARQSEFLGRCVSAIRRYYAQSLRAQSVSDGTIVVGHSMGGIVARYAMVTGSVDPVAVLLVATLSTPHAFAPVLFDSQMTHIYRAIQARDLPPSHVPPLLSISGGFSDTLIRGDSTVVTGTCDARSHTPPHVTPATYTGCALSVASAAMPGVWVDADHNCAVWCNQIVTALALSLAVAGTRHVTSRGKQDARGAMERENASIHFLAQLFEDNPLVPGDASHNYRTKHAVSPSAESTLVHSWHVIDDDTEVLIPLNGMAVSGAALAIVAPFALPGYLEFAASPDAHPVRNVGGSIRIACIPHITHSARGEDVALGELRVPLATLFTANYKNSGLEGGDKGGHPRFRLIPSPGTSVRQEYAVTRADSLTSFAGVLVLEGAEAEALRVEALRCSTRTGNVSSTHIAVGFRGLAVGSLQQSGWIAAHTGPITALDVTVGLLGSGETLLLNKSRSLLTRVCVHGITQRWQSQSVSIVSVNGCKGRLKTVVTQRSMWSGEARHYREASAGASTSALDFRIQFFSSLVEANRAEVAHVLLEIVSDPACELSLHFRADASVLAGQLARFYVPLLIPATFTMSLVVPLGGHVRAALSALVAGMCATAIHLATADDSSDHVTRSPFDSLSDNALFGR
eukprot:Opistho-2@75615